MDSLIKYAREDMEFTYIDETNEEIELSYDEDDLRRAAIKHCVTVIDADGLEEFLLGLNSDVSETCNNLIVLLVSGENPFFSDILKNKQEVIDIVEQAAIDKFNRGL